VIALVTILAQIFLPAIHTYFFWPKVLRLQRLLLFFSLIGALIYGQFGALRLRTCWRNFLKVRDWILRLRPTHDRAQNEVFQFTNPFNLRPLWNRKWSHL